MREVNPFVLCNLAAKLTRRTFRSPVATPMSELLAGDKLERSIKINIRATIKFLNTGSTAEREQKNVRSARFSFLPREFTSKGWESTAIDKGLSRPSP